MSTQRPLRRWSDVVADMLGELRQQEPRADTYWAQQLAFGPVLAHALALAVRRGDIDARDLEHVRRAVALALRGLGALPDGPGVDARGLAILARRQATALAAGRRRHLLRLAQHLGLPADGTGHAPVDRRMLRPYPLLGWLPDPR
jgi:hypothetical protein